MDSKFKNRIISALRKLSYIWKPVQDVKKRAKKAPATYECESCHYWCYEGSSEKNFDKLTEEFPSQKFKMEKANVDHKNPVRSVEEGFVDWNTFIERMFCDEDNLKLLCKTCHKEKTKLETKERVKYRKIRKDNAKST